MKQTGDRKTIFEYIIGVLILTAVVLLALFGPTLYVTLQDERQIGQVRLDNWDTIRFLNVDSLDIADRIDMLSHAKTLDWSPVNYNAALLDESNIRKKQKKLIVQWEEYGILPKDTERLISDSVGQTGGLQIECEYYPYSVIAESSVMNVIVTANAAYMDYDGQTESIGALITIMDSDLDMLYYVGLFGSSYWDEMASRIGRAYGVNTYAELQVKWIEQGGKLKGLRMEEFGNLGAAAGVLEWSVSDKKTYESWEKLQQDFVLTYDNFSADARVQLAACEEAGYGYTVMLGTSLWENWLFYVFEYMGITFYIENGTVDQWMEDPFVFERENEDIRVITETEVELEGEQSFVDGPYENTMEAFGF